MHRISFVAATLAVATSATFFPLTAQTLAGVPVEFGVMGGFTKPVGNLGGDANHAWNVGGLMSLGTPSSHVSFRLDGQWRSWMDGSSVEGCCALVVLTAQPAPTIAC